MTGSLSQMLSLSIVSIVAYIVATLLRSKPIYESLLERLLEKQRANTKAGEKDSVQRSENSGQKILTNFVVHYNSRLDDVLISEVDWPNNCLLVAIQRGTEEIIPKGKTKLQVGDVIVTLTDERDRSYVHEKMEALCREMF